MLGGDAGGRFVQDQRFDAQSQQANDLQLLALGNQEVVDELVGVQFKAETRGQLAQARFGLRPLKREAIGAAVNKILQDGESADIQRVLLQHADAIGDGRRRAGIVDSAIIDQDLASVRRLEAGENLHQGRFSGAILAQNPDNPPMAELDVDVVIRVDGAKTLVDVPQFNIHLVTLRPSPLSPSLWQASQRARKGELNLADSSLMGSVSKGDKQL